MSVYEHSIIISRRPDEVFSVVADAGQVPSYSATIRRVERQASDLVRIEAAISGFYFSHSGFYKADSELRRIDFGSSEGGDLIRGWTQVKTGPDPGTSDLTVRLELNFSPEQERLRSQMADFDNAIKEVLRSNLESLKNYCEGHGDPVNEADTAAAPA